MFQVRGFGLKKQLSLLLGLFLITLWTPPPAGGTSIEVSYSHRVIPRGLSPDPDVVNLEGGIWATFLSDNPVFPATTDTSLHQISDLVYKHFFPWNWSEPFEVRFVDGNNDTTTVVAAPEPAFPFDPSVHGVPTINIHTAPANLWDPEIGIYVWGNDYNFLQNALGLLDDEKRS